MVTNSLAKRVVSSVLGTRVIQPFGTPALRAAQFALGLCQREVVSFAQPHRAGTAARIRAIVTSLGAQTVGVDEAFTIHNAVLATAGIPGDLAEVGVFRGGTARVICEAKGARPLHLFDTFQGLPAPGPLDTAFEAGQYASTRADVERFLSGFQDVHFHEGLFPDTALPLNGHRFSFVHLDVDLYESTLAALRFFFPRLNRGGMLISHDYVEFEGVRSAFHEYFPGTAQPVLELTGNQCLVVKVSE